MQRSTNGILTSHTGSLPRPPELSRIFWGAGDIEQAAYDDLLRDSVAQVVRRQADVGVDVLSDGEMGKESYATYVRERLTGFHGETEGVVDMTDMLDYPNFFERWAGTNAESVGAALQPPACVGEIKVKDRSLLQQDIDNLRAATSAVPAKDVFMTAATPGVIAAFFANHHYSTREEFMSAIADAMREEYEAITAAGYILQLDCPDLAMCRHLQFNDSSVAEFRRQAHLNVEILDHATANIDPDQMRMHLCWGNYEGPHHKDVPLRDIIDIVLSARPNAISLEAANPRHDHEWRVFEEVGLPDGKVLIPGVVDTTTNYIEHPELIAQRLARYARLVGMENVIAGSDCGFGTTARLAYVDPDIAWAKLGVMAEGAKLATAELSRA